MNVNYQQHEFHQPNPTNCDAPLTEFVLDVPYLVFLGVIPPLYILNEVLKTGGGDGGMSPGTSWTSFAIAEEKYEALVSALVSLDLKKLRRRGTIRFVPDRIIIDESLHNERTHISWVKRVSDNYRKK